MFKMLKMIGTFIQQGCVKLNKSDSSTVDTFIMFYTFFYHFTMKTGVILRIN